MYFSFFLENQFELVFQFEISTVFRVLVVEYAYSAKSAHPFRRNGAPFRLKLSNAQLVN